MELLAFAVWCFLVALAGGLVGLVLGNIRLPATLHRRQRRGGGRRSEPPHQRHRRRHRVDRAHPRGACELAAVRVDGAAVDRRALCSAATPRGSSTRTSCSDASRSSCSTARSTCFAGRRGPRRRRRRAAEPAALRPARGDDQRRAHRPARRARRAHPRDAAPAGAHPLRRRDAGSGPSGRTSASACASASRARSATCRREGPTGPSRPSALLASIPGALLGSRLTGRLSEAQLVRAIADHPARRRGGDDHSSAELTRARARHRHVGARGARRPSGAQVCSWTRGLRARRRWRRARGASRTTRANDRGSPRRRRARRATTAPATRTTRRRRQRPAPAPRTMQRTRTSSRPPGSRRSDASGPQGAPALVTAGGAAGRRGGGGRRRPRRRAGPPAGAGDRAAARADAARRRRRTRARRAVVAEQARVEGVVRRALPLVEVHPLDLGVPVGELVEPRHAVGGALLVVLKAGRRSAG